MSHRSTQKLGIFAAFAATCLGVSAVQAATVTKVFPLENATYTGFAFDVIIPQGSLPTGSMLQSVGVNATLTNSINDVYVTDLCVYFITTPAVDEGTLQVGGGSEIGAKDLYGWAYGGAGTVGSTLIDTQDVANLNIDLATLQVYVGNGYRDFSAAGTWNGSVSVTYLNPSALEGDFNSDGIVDQTDLNLVNSHWQQAGVGYANGDGNLDGVVDQLDLNIVNGHWQNTSGSSIVSVPEPTSVGAILLGGLALARRRRD